MKNFILMSLAILAACLQTGCVAPRSPSAKPTAEIVGHRGASYDAPENTMASFKLGFRQNADADECDIYLTKDGQIAIMHDGDTARTSGVTNKIAETTLADLRRLNVGDWGKWKGKGFSEPIPTLDELLAIIPKGKRVFIEIKCGPEVLPALEQALKRAGKAPAQTALIGFGYETVKEAKARFPKLQVYFLASASGKPKKYPSVDELIQKAKAANLDGLDLEQGFPIDSDFVAKVHSAGLKLFTWTVDDAEVARKEVAAGVDGITTNRPEWLRQQLATQP